MAKRNYRRFALELADDTQGSRLEDVSAGGMRLLSDKVFKIDQRFPTKIGSPEGPISVQARIVRACLSRREGYRYEYGAQLVMASEADKSRMKRFVQHLSESLFFCFRPFCTGDPANIIILLVGWATAIRCHKFTF